MNSIRVDLGFSAYGNIPTALAGQLDMTSGVTAVGAIHQTATLPVCTRCGASVPIPYQERHAEWHADLNANLQGVEQKADYANDDPDDWTGPISVIREV